jgi:hypothetical protein
MQKKSTFSALSEPQIILLAMVILAVVTIFFIHCYFDFKIKMLRHQSRENVKISTINKTVLPIISLQNNSP